VYLVPMGLMSPWLKGVIFFAAWTGGLIVVMRIGYARLRLLSERTRTDLDDIVLTALKVPLAIVIVVSGGLILSRILPLSAEWDKGIGLGVKIALVLAGMVFADRLLKGALRHYSTRVDFLRTSSGIVQTGTRGVIVLLALLIILDTSGVSITPLIASLGVGSLGIALALQSPLGNFFAGLQIVTAKPIEIGQYISLSSGESGYVTKIGWRSTTIRMLRNNLIVIPNSKIADAIITNYDLPEKEQSILIDVGVHYDSDLEQVERVTCEVAKEVLQAVQGGKKDFEPFIRYHTFGDSSINFTVILRVEEFVSGYAVKHEFVKRLHKRFRDEGIVIPFPIRTLDIKREDLLLIKQGPTTSGGS
jgi:small-conductance mechanosensitive channel